MNHKYHDVIVAFSEGKDIQCKYTEHNHWTDIISGPGVTFPDFNAHGVEWRIKPASRNLRYKLALMVTGLYSEYYYIVCFIDGQTSNNPENDKNFVKWIIDWTQYEI